jgi:diguanylate cyclase (GGDEF)-like protein/PAS domain S-box-containing protein
MVDSINIFHSDSIYKQLLDETEAYIYTKDLMGRYTYVNKLMQELLGGDIEHILGKNYDDFFTASRANKLLKYERKVLEKGLTIIKNNTLNIIETGDIKVFHTVKKPIYKENIIIGLMGVSTDITKLKTEKEAFEAMFHYSKETIGIVDLQSNFIQVNKAYADMSGYTKKELLNTSCIALTHEDDIISSQEAMKEVLRAGYIKNFIKRCISKSGKILTVEMSMSLLHNPSRVLLSVKDISDVRKYQDKLKYLASTDSMTKLYNRRYFSDISKEYIIQAQQEKKTLSLIILDIDTFKMINDTHGHKIGDDVIISLANILKKSVRSNDIIARLGGDEFVIMLPSASQDIAIRIAEKIRHQVENICIKIDNEEKISFTISLGLATLKAHCTLDTLLQRADKMLYIAKKSGRNKVSYL